MIAAGGWSDDSEHGGFEVVAYVGVVNRSARASLDKRLCCVMVVSVRMGVFLYQGDVGIPSAREYRGLCDVY